MPLFASFFRSNDIKVFAYVLHVECLIHNLLRRRRLTILHQILDVPQPILIEGQTLALERLYEEPQTVKVFGQCAAMAPSGSVYRAIYIVNVGEQVEKGSVEGHSMSDLMR